MKKFYLVSLICFFVSQVSAQRRKIEKDSFVRFQITGAIGSVYMSGLASELDAQAKWGLRLDFAYKIALADKHALITGAGIESNHFIVDGVFSKNSQGQYVFGRTPDNYKQHEMIMEYIQVPLLYSYDWLGANSGGVSIGPYFSYLTAARSEYKIASSKFRDNMFVENRAHWGFRFEIESIFGRKARGRQRLILGLGGQYQVSGFLDEGKSYKPFFAYFKAGMGIARSRN